MISSKSTMPLHFFSVCTAVHVKNINFLSGKERLHVMENGFQDIDFSFMVPNRELDTGTVRKNKHKSPAKEPHALENSTESEKTANNHVRSAEHKEASREGKSSPQLLPHSLEPNINLSRDELLKLLSVFEGELQARDEVIAILKTECSQNPETRYGLASQPAKALQRDAATLDIGAQDQINEQTKDQLKKIIEHQKDSYRKLKQLLFASQDKYQRLSMDAEDDKRKHQEYMSKSDDFVNLLERDRERLKQMLEQEKGVHERKEKELLRRFKENKDELSRLKTLSLELVEERQQQLQKLNEQSKLNAAHQRQVEELQAKLKETEKTAATEKDHATQLENELEEQSNKFYRENELLASSLVLEENKNKQLEEKVTGLTKQLKRLKCVEKNLRKTDDQLWKIQEKLEQERNEDLLEEVELLRNTVKDMQEAEKIYVQAQDECKELREALEEELTHTKALAGEVERLRKHSRNQTEMERCVEEANFRLDEMQQLFDAECKKANKMKDELEAFRTKLVKIDETEETLKLTEAKVKQLQQARIALADERDALATKLKLEKDKCEQCLEMLDDERNTVTKVTQKMIEETKKALKAKEELAALERSRAEETESLRQKLKNTAKDVTDSIPKIKLDQMEALNNNLRKQIAMLKTRLDKLEDENDARQNELHVAKKDSEKAKQNLQISTDKLKRLVTLGLNEQVAIAQYEEMKETNSNLENLNETLKQQLQAAEEKLQQHTDGNANNNNIFLKGIAIHEVATQTTPESPSGGTSPTGRNTRGVSLARAGSVESGRTSPAVRRTSSSGSFRRENSIDGRAPRGTTSPVGKFSQSATTSRSASLTRQQRPGTGGKPNRPFVVHLKGKPEKCGSPVSMTVSHNPAKEGTPTFKIVCDSKTGSPHIETSITDSKKGIQIRMSNKNNDATKPPASSAKTPGKTPFAKINNRTAAPPPSSSVIRGNGAQAQTVTRKSSVSPTRIPKPRGGATPSPTPGSPATTRFSRGSASSNR